MADPKPQTLIKPVDDVVLAGFQQRMCEQFRAKAIYSTSPDNLVNLKAQIGNNQPEYPYMFMYVSTVSRNPDGYTTNRLARHGIPVTVNDDNRQVQTAKLFPTNFEIEITYITNEYEGLDTDSVKGFVRRWLFSSRNGALNMTVRYGLTSLPISYTMSDSLTIPKRESPADTESVYQVVANVTLHGYVSEAALNTRGRINEVVLAEGPALQPGSQFFPF